MEVSTFQGSCGSSGGTFARGWAATTGRTPPTPSTTSCLPVERGGGGCGAKVVVVVVVIRVVNVIMVWL